ncbi:MAG: YcjF family protein [Planctomycetes bacterium]|nr:YcjF family protein [Planctomycetota bacterium]
MAQAMKKGILSIASRIGLALLLVLAFLAVMEFIRACQTLYAVHPWAGYALLGLGGLVVLWILWVLIRLMFVTRPVLKPPKIADHDSAAPRELRHYSAYLVKYLRRLADNPNLAQDSPAARQWAEELRRSAASAGGRGELLTAIRKAETQAVEPLLAKLDQQAETEIRDCMATVMVWVAMSPWNQIDMLVVLAKNASLVVRVTGIYRGRPGWREQALIFANVIATISAIKLGSLAKTFMQNVLGSLPGTAKVVESLTQLVGVGYLTSVVGHMTLHRCRAFRGWGKQEAQQYFIAHMGNFAKDCWSIAKDIVMPRVQGVCRWVVDLPGSVWDGLKNAFSFLTGEQSGQPAGPQQNFTQPNYPRQQPLVAKLLDDPSQQQR